MFKFVSNSYKYIDNVSIKCEIVTRIPYIADHEIAHYILPKPEIYYLHYSEVKVNEQFVLILI